MYGKFSSVALSIGEILTHLNSSRSEGNGYQISTDQETSKEKEQDIVKVAVDAGEGWSR